MLWFEKRTYFIALFRGSCPGSPAGAGAVELAHHEGSALSHPPQDQDEAG